MAAKTYVTIQGDTWDGIAYRLWGEERLMGALLACNPDHADVLIFSGGVELNLPDILPRNNSLSWDLPPWM